MSYPKILDAIPLPDYFVLLTFDNEKVGMLDMKVKFNEDIYKPLIDKTLFAQVKTDAGGYGISWNDEIDMSEVECRELCKFGSLLIAENGTFRLLHTSHDKNLFRLSVQALLKANIDS
jgi:hypothetical protein